MKKADTASTGRFSILAALVHAFHSRALYREVGFHWRWRAFRYLLAVLGLAWIPFTLWLHTALSEFVDDDAPAIVRQIPPVAIRHGRVSTDVEQPYFIHVGHGDETFVVAVDTTGQLESLDEIPAKVLLTESALLYRRSPSEIRIYDLSRIEEFHVDRLICERWLRAATMWGPIALYPFFVIGSCVYRVGQALLYSLVGMIFARLLSAPTDFAGVLSITIVALTPAIALKTAVWMTGVALPLAWLAYLVVALGYMYFGIRALSAPIAASAAVGRAGSADGMAP